jgi:hypothetical protein
MPQTRVANGESKAFEFVLGAFGAQLNPPIRQVADCPNDFKTSSHRFRGITKSDALDPA